MLVSDKTSEITYHINEKIVYRLMGNEAVILDLVSGEYFSLNRTGTKVLQAITRQKTIGQIIELFMRSYGVKEDQARSDISDLLIQLKNDRIILESTKNVR